MIHFRDVNELKVLLNRMASGLPVGAAESRLFDTSAVAKAISSYPKVIRHLVFTRQLESEPPRNGKSRKLFFRARSVHDFLQSRGTAPGREVLRHATIVANPRGAITGLGLTKSEVAKELGIRKRAVERYLASGLLKTTAVSSRRQTLITLESVNDFRLRMKEALIKARGKIVSGIQRRRPRPPSLWRAIS